MKNSVLILFVHDQTSKEKPKFIEEVYVITNLALENPGLDLK